MTALHGAEPRTTTIAYGSGRCAVAATQIGPDRSDLLLAAAHGARDGNCLDSATVEQICSSYEDAVSNLNIAETETDALRRELAEARRVANELHAQLLAERDAHQVTVLDLEGTEVMLRAEQIEALRLQALHIKLSSECAAKTKERIDVAFERLTVRVTGESYEAVSERLTAEQQRQWADDALRSPSIVVNAPVPPAREDFDFDTVVVDPLESGALP